MICNPSCMKVRGLLGLPLVIFVSFFLFLSPVFASQPTEKCIRTHWFSYCFPIPPKGRPFPKPTKVPRPTRTPKPTHTPKVTPTVIPTVTLTPTLTPTPTPISTPTPTPGTLVISDDFNDGNLEKWELGGSLRQPSVLGAWRIDGGALLQDNGNDGVWAAVKDHEFSDVVVSSDIRQVWQSAGLGFLFWFQDSNNWSSAVATPGMQQVSISENINGVESSSYYSVTSMHDGGDWYNIQAEIDSVSGVVKVYVGGDLVATRTMTTPLRRGKLALMTGNAGGWFDNFKLIAPQP